MKCIRIITVVVFACIIVLPVVFFNFTPNVASSIDNRMLTEFPLTDGAAGSDLTAELESYVNDRIGFRDEMIIGYTVLNDRLFGKMVHPSYSYGKDDYVFGAGITTAKNAYSEFHEAFADMVLSIQNYCEARGVPFLFVFNPAKPAVLTEYLPDGVRYDRSWVDRFFAALDERGVRYVDNTQTLRTKTEEGEVVYNQKYDANHWNDLGAYYGTNAILEELQRDFPSVHVNGTADLNMDYELKTSLPVSEFPIHEMVPAFTLKSAVDPAAGELYKNELEMHPSYQTFGYYVNQEADMAGAPRLLSFQGSFMNVLGRKFMANSVREYIYVHDYQNILEFPYYYNIFQPDCVVFEVAEYTFNNEYFNYEKMLQLDMNPVLSSVTGEGKPRQDAKLDRNQISVESGAQLTKISWNTDADCEYAWLLLEREYDAQDGRGL